MFFDFILALVAAPLIAVMTLFGFMMHVWNRESHQFWHVTVRIPRKPR